ncbi:MAG: DUF4974 domain-containing protein [Candidatus Pseudobacter hemicellulosilyticus]|uniref:DUF4974 domain-containing protein n=1 Tax=Candidatus Pseudobacter hemicellulosilyticus TaxID=3121375 RepID=A0AAJ5WKZ2_9BACT|nr:MAG: DUF4974 domain-containing protein [Pseudobacter sp.]
MLEEILPPGLLAVLYKKANAHPLEPGEEALLADWIGQSPHKEAFVQQLSNEDAVWEDLKARYGFAPEGEWARMQQRITADAGIETPPAARLRSLRPWRWAAAAVFLLMAGGAWFWWNRQPGMRDIPTPIVQQTPIAPGKDGAILTLADGRQLVLDSLGNGVVASESGASVYLNNGQLAYNRSTGQPGAGQPAADAYNILSTPRGRQFTVVLPDGSRVWLNAASSIRYATGMTGSRRVVELLQGEGYFEVAPHNNQDFVVQVGQQATVLQPASGSKKPGFNINAYQDEPGILVTAVEGGARVLSGLLTQEGTMPVNAKTQELQPGTQATLQAGSIRLQQPDMGKVLAWKNGFFNFENANLQSVMKQLERWYDIEVVYEKQPPPIFFVGKLSRKMTLEGVLKTLEESEVHFRMEGRKLIVRP